MNLLKKKKTTKKKTTKKKTTEEKDAEDKEDEDKDAEDKDEEEKVKKELGPMLDGMPESFIGPQLAHLVAHEVGHTLGLRHNFKASSAYSLDQVNSVEYRGKPLRRQRYGLHADQHSSGIRYGSG